jgi:hypothetical protein
MDIDGRCHCGNIAFRFTRPDAERVPARACTCTFCTRHGGVWTSHPQGVLRVQLAHDEDVSRYTFGTGTAEFLVCRHCGVVPVVTSAVQGRLYAVVNVNCCEALPPERLERATVSFDDEDEPVRLARRARGWIGDVQITAS